MSKAIEVIIQPDGSLKIDAVGFTGSDCDKATAFLEKALGQATGKSRKPEYFTTARRAQQQRAGQ
jgi:hypothetical protein